MDSFALSSGAGAAARGAAGTHEGLTCLAPRQGLEGQLSLESASRIHCSFVESSPILRTDAGDRYIKVSIHLVNTGRSAQVMS